MKPPWHSAGRSPLRLARTGSQQTARRAVELPTPQALEAAKKAPRRLERDKGPAIGQIDQCDRETT
jgi:hypothetical protein